MSVSRRWTSADLEQLDKNEFQRYEIIGGELIVTSAPSWQHQFVSTRICRALSIWDDDTEIGLAHSASGLIFNPEDDVIPDVLWISFERMRRGTDRAGHFHVAPELVVEVLSPGRENERRDREMKLDLYSREGVDEYWIVDWRQRTIDVFRRDGDLLKLFETFAGDGILESPVLPGFRLQIARIWPPTL